MSIIIKEEYVKINHPILDEICPICDKHFKVGDSIELVPIQKSKDKENFDAISIPIHTDCYFV